jgi:hypothetical protein
MVVTASVRKAFFLSSGGKIYYEAQGCGGLRRLNINAKEADEQRNRGKL